MKQFIIAALTILMVSACIKEPDWYSNPPHEGVADLVVPESFDWSGITASELSVTITNASGMKSLVLDGQPLDILDANDNRISRTIVQDGKAGFAFKFDSNIQHLFISSPVTLTAVEITAQTHTFNFVASDNAGDAFRALADSDGDGMPDALDEFPSDPNKAYTVSFPAAPNSSYQVQNRAATDAYPVGSNYYFQIFEDLWPSTGDYDLNDLIVASTISLTYNGGGFITNGRYVTRIWAVGADVNFPHGFGIEFFKKGLDGKLAYMPSGTVTLSANSASDLYGKAYTVPDANVKNAIVLWSNVNVALSPYYNNVGGSWGVSGVPQTVTFNFDVNPAVEAKNMELLSYLFGTVDPTSVIRTVGSPPTEHTSMARFGTSDDASPTTGWSFSATDPPFVYPLSIGGKSFYQTAGNLPWAVEFITSNFKVPLEETSILDAYPEFGPWAESGGVSYGNWYTNPVEAKVVTVGAPGTVTDVDGNIYTAVVLGTQTWMVENLKVTHYRNGDPIPNVPGPSWTTIATGAYCDYNNDVNNEVATYGRLYNWFAVNDSRNIAPVGWHVPTDAEWATLTSYVGGVTVAGGKLKETGFTHWDTPNTGATNETRFTALPSGLRNNGSFSSIKTNGYWWSTTVYPSDVTRAWRRYMVYNTGSVDRLQSNKTNGLSVRCVKD